MAEIHEHDAMDCRACGREERASEGYPCASCGTFICLICTFPRRDALPTARRPGTGKARPVTRRGPASPSTLPAAPARPPHDSSSSAPPRAALRPADAARRAGEPARPRRDRRRARVRRRLAAHPVHHDGYEGWAHAGYLREAAGRGRIAGGARRRLEPGRGPVSESVRLPLRARARRRRRLRLPDGRRAGDRGRRHRPGRDAAAARQAPERWALEHFAGAPYEWGGVTPGVSTAPAWCRPRSPRAACPAARLLAAGGGAGTRSSRATRARATCCSSAARRRPASPTSPSRGRTRRWCIPRSPRRRGCGAGARHPRGPLHERLVAVRRLEER